VALLDHLPDLAAHLSPATAERARSAAVAPVLRIEAGAWDPATTPLPVPGRTLGMVVLDGVLTRTVAIEGRGACELIGPGDVIDPVGSADAVASLETETKWNALEGVTLAVLGGPFLRAAGQFPDLLAALLERGIDRSRNIAAQLAIARARRAEDRVRRLFWHMADRWGRVTPAGTVVPLRFTHAVIGELVCLRRPSVTTALCQLADSGELTRRFDGTWLLARPGPSPRRIEAMDH
jgi:CRP-like cAMP-binding protein